MPSEVISRAKEILKKIENDEIDTAFKTDKKADEQTDQIGFADTTALEITAYLKDIDVTTLTPIEAMNTLYTLVRKANLE